MGTAEVGAEQLTGVRRLLALASATAVLRFVSFGLSFLITLLLARFLGKSGYGVYALASSWATLLAFPAILGFDRFMLRGLAVYLDRRQWSLGRGLLLRANHLVLVTSCVIGAAAAVVCAVVSSPALRVALPLAMVMIPINNLVLVRQGVMQALGRVIRGQLPEYLIRPGVIVVVLVGVHALAPRSLTPVGAVAIAVAATSIAFAIGAAGLLRVLPEALRSAATSYRTREWVRAAVPMMFVASIITINNQVSILLVGAIAGHQSAGVFNVAETGATITALVLLAATVPLAPELARLHARGDLPAMEHTARRVAQWALLGSVPLACIFATVPGFLLGLFGNGFSAGATAMVIMALAQLVNAAAGPAGNVLLMSGHERRAAVGVLSGAITNLAFGLALIPSLGLTGGAIGEAGSTVVWNLAMLVLVRRTVGINAAAFGPRMLK